jgi:hypothetical protein
MGERSEMRHEAPLPRIPSERPAYRGASESSGGGNSSGLAGSLIVTVALVIGIIWAIVAIVQRLF